MVLTIKEQLRLTATEAVAAIQSGKLKATEYITTLLAHAKSLSELNALTMLNGKNALDSARRIDTLSLNERAYLPLAGLPIVVKININVMGLTTSAGTPALEHHIAHRNAPSVQRLLDAGAIVFGQANMHELAYGITSTNFAQHAGFVRNPYDWTRIPGGSSGGTAAAIAARIVPAGLGTDTGGSTRIPAALTGTAGFRPSVGNGGKQRRYHDPDAVVPVSHTRDTVGPMARTVADLVLLDEVLTNTKQSTPPITLQGLRIGLPVPLWEGLEHAVNNIALAAVEQLEAAGVIMVPVAMPELLSINEKISNALVLHETLEDLPIWLIGNAAPVSTVAQVTKDIASPDVRAIYSEVHNSGANADYKNALKLWRPAFQRLYAKVFAKERIAALLFPTTILTAVPIDEIQGSSTVSINGGPPINTMKAFIRNTEPGSNAGIPGLSLPVGLTSRGLPVGLELDGPLGHDRDLLAIGVAFEQLLGVLPAPVFFKERDNDQNVFSGF